MANTLRFFWNGIKGSDGKLQKAWYSAGELHSFPTGTITIYARTYDSFSAEVRNAFTVENDSDIITDYFAKDLIRVTPEHPLYGPVKIALAAHTAHFDKRFGKVAA
jgi:hypothetical protein